ncbi:MULTISPECIES: DUF4031 domain-containing protein [unclassified Rhizobium]
MATRLGVRCWFQDKPGAPHYDLSKKTRAVAIRYGAREITSRELLMVAKRCS